MAELDGRLCGFAHIVFYHSTSIARPVCFLVDLFVAAPLHGRGIGHALMDALYAYARQAGAQRVYCSGAMSMSAPQKALSAKVDHWRIWSSDKSHPIKSVVFEEIQRCLRIALAWPKVEKPVVAVCHLPALTYLPNGYR